MLYTMSDQLRDEGREEGRKQEHELMLKGFGLSEDDYLSLIELQKTQPDKSAQDILKEYLLKSKIAKWDKFPATSQYFTCKIIIM